MGEGTLGLRTPTSGNLLGSGREPYRDKSKIKNRRKFRHRHSINSGFFFLSGKGKEIKPELGSGFWGLGGIQCKHKKRDVRLK